MYWTGRQSSFSKAQNNTQNKIKIWNEKIYRYTSMYFKKGLDGRKVKSGNIFSRLSGFKTFSSYNNIFGTCKLQPNKKWPLSSKPSEIFSDLNHKFIIIQMHNWHKNQDSKSSLNLLSKNLILSFIGLFYWSLSILWVTFTIVVHIIIL